MVQPAEQQQQQRWRRSRYPLHSSSLSASQSNRAEKPSSGQFSGDAQVSTGLEPQHEKHRSTVLQRNEESHQQSEQTQDDDTTRMSSTSRSSSPWSTSSVNYHIATTMPLGEDRQKEVQNLPDDPDPGRRTLRRTPRSRRIEARVSLADMDAAAANTQPKEATSHTAADNNDHVQPAVSANATRQSEYNALPASPPLSGSEASSPTTSHSSQHDEGKAAAAKNKMWQHRTYPLQAPASRTDLRRPPTPPSPTPKSAQRPPIPQNQRSQPAADNGDASIPRHQAYPLQSAPPVSNVQHSSSTPSEPASKTASTAESAKAAAPASEKKILRRRGYPLQSSASISNLRHQSPLSPQPPTSEPAKAQMASATRSEQKPAPETTKKESPGRQTYPLQSPASIANLRGSKSGSDPDDQKNAKQTATNGEAALKNKAVRRQKYPLQSPMSFTNLKYSPSPSTSAPASQNSTPERKDNDDAGTSSSAFRRQAYPLQSRSSRSNSQQSLPSSGQNSQASNQQAREESQSATGPPRSRRPKYPLHSSGAGASTHHVPPSYPASTAASEARTEEESSSNSPPPQYSPQQKQVEPREETSAVLLPKNIRAVKDSEKPLKGRTIVVCLDGTGDKFDDDNSNIVHIVSALKKDDAQQVTYYQAGIGTYNDGGLSTGFAAAADMAVGSGLGLHVRDAYHFLMHSYKEGDRICIFGFSRGAYTARCLGGMIHKVGLLPPRNIQQIQFAYEFYKSDTAEGWKQSEDFKRAFSIDVNIHFIGCFDSVASVGFIPRQLPLSSTPANKPHYFRHAIALDERRAKFKACRYQSAKKQGQLEKVKTFNAETDEAVSKALDKVARSKAHDEPPQYSSGTPFGKEHHPNVTDEEYQSLYSHDDDFDTDVSEVWFAGCHADVGGGAVANTERHKLAQIPLRWMIRQAFECNTGIIFKTRFLVEYGIDVHTLWPKYGKLEVPKTLDAPPANYLRRYETALPPRSIRCGKLVPVRKRGEDHSDHHGEPLYHLNSHTDQDWTPEQIEDYYDAMTPMNDQLVQAPSWWILEALPVQYKISTKPGEVQTVTGPNMGLGRLVEERDAQVHWTVIQRAHQLGYKAAARPAMHTEWRVVT